MAASSGSRLALLTQNSSLVSGLALVLAAVVPLPTQAQIMPDMTLGAEASQVTPGAQVSGVVADLIEGGAIRGSNLFHSFLEFNINAGQRVYFANPAGVESILSRVTGANPSNIFGTLGVDGAADLFLINPNGIVFGENAALDIEGSFYATTAAAIPLGDGVYSATEPAQSSLLTVSPSALFSSYLTQASGDIENRGQLAAQGDLTLAANNLDLQGQVAAGGDLTLLGNAVQIRDTVAVPFVGFAGGDLLVQGNEGVDIVALSHPESGLYSYGDMVLRSGNPVGGDAHYWSGGSFRVEHLDEGLGELFSPIDPVIRALGDVAIFGYQGGSLHILAGGSVNIGTAIITDADPGELGVDFLRETITLSDGTVIAIDGGAQPTLDVRAGVAPAVIGLIPPGNVTGLDPTFLLLGLNATNEPTSADIALGDVLMAAPNGLVLLTTQYQPNTDLAGGNIFVTGEGLRGVGIDARGFGGQGGAVYVDARNDVSVIDSTIQTSGAGVVRDVVINASSNIRFDQQNRLTGVASDLVAGTEGTGGSIRITATNVEVRNGAQLQASTFGNGDAGNVVIHAGDRVVFDGTSADGQVGSGALSRVEAGATGAGGNVEINANSLEVLNGGVLSASTSGTGDAGNVVIQVGDRVVFDDGNAGSVVGAEATGAGGNVEINANSLEVLNGTLLSVSTLGNGDAGNVVIQAEGRVVFDGTSVALSSVEGGAGAGGNVEINANFLEVLNGSELSASTLGNGDAGNVLIQASDRVVFDGGAAGSIVGAEATGAGGNVEIAANSLEVLNGGVLSASTLGTGDAGNVVINVDGQMRVTNGTISSFALATSGGRIDIRAGNLILRENSNIATFVGFGKGNGGNITIIADFVIALDNSDILAFSADGSGGAIDLSRTTFFGQNANIGFGDLTREELLALVRNGRVDINASGGVEPGQIAIGDSSFIENSLTSLADTIVDTSALTAGSCIARTSDSLGSFVATGSGGLPQRPGDTTLSTYPTGTVRAEAAPTAAVQEPDGVYQLSDGRLVLSRTCE